MGLGVYHIMVDWWLQVRPAVVHLRPPQGSTRIEIPDTSHRLALVGAIVLTGGVGATGL